MQNNLTLKELSEKFLKEIYNQYQKGKDRVSMEEIGNEFNMKHHSDKIIRITDLLESKNLISVIVKFSDGIALVSLTPDAIMRIEEKGEFNLVSPAENQVNISHYSGNFTNSQINTNSNNISQVNNANDIDSLINLMLETVKSNNEINENVRRDLFAELQIIKFGTMKSEPDKNWLLEKVEQLRKISFLFPYVPGLIECIKNIRI